VRANNFDFRSQEMSRLRSTGQGTSRTKKNAFYEKICGERFDRSVRLADGIRRSQFRRANVFTDPNSNTDADAHARAGGNQGGSVVRSEDGEDHEQCFYFD